MNDSLIKGCFNIARSGESYFYTYLKVKQLVKSNPRVKKILVEFSNNQLSEGMNEWIWGDNFLKDKYPRYSRFMAWDDYQILIRHNPSAIAECEALRMKDRMNLLFGRRKNFLEEYNWGGYLFNHRNKVDSLLKAGPQVDDNSQSRSISEINLAYLQKIKSVCDDNGVELFLVRCPLHPAYPLSNEGALRDLLDKQMNSVTFLDFKNFTLPNTHYGDLEHLNYLGANEFSSFLNVLINEGLLSLPEKQERIDSAIEKRAAKNNLIATTTQSH